MKKVLVSSIVTLLSVCLFGGSASAATPPDSCFAFSGGAITDYYTNENNDSANPACPRDVDIPSTINGAPVRTIDQQAFAWDYNDEATRLTAVTIPNTVTTIGGAAFQANRISSVTIPDSVTTVDFYAFISNELTSVEIGNSVAFIGATAFGENKLTTVTIPDSVVEIAEFAFLNNQLTTVTIPDSVTTLGSYAFQGNQLTDVTISNSVTSLGAGAFQANKLTTVTIPNSVTSIDNTAFILQNPAGGDFDYGSSAVYDTIWYAQLSVAGPNALVLQDGAPTLCSRYDDNYTECLEQKPAGGHLINPARTTTTFKSSTGETLRSPQTITGQKTDGTLIPDYLVVNGPVIPAAANPDSPTPEEQAAQRQALQAYYRIGQSQTFTAPAITGYTGPVPASPYTTRLAAADNTINFVYTPESDEGETPATPTQPTRPNQPGQGSDPAEEGELAETGVDSRFVIVIASLLLTASFVMFVGQRRLANR